MRLSPERNLSKFSSAVNQIKKRDRILTRSAEWSACTALTIAFMISAGPGSVLAAPPVTNLVATQRAGTKLVDITYDLAAPEFSSMTVGLEISSDSGATWTIPAVSISGDIGPGVVPGVGKTIVWNAGTDWAGNYTTQMRFRVKASDIAPAGFSLIPGGSFSMGRTSGDTDSNAPPVTVSVSSFYLAGTETTKSKWDDVRMWAVNNGYTDLAVGGGKAANHPVHSITWFDAVKWCNAQSERESLTACYTVGGNVMRTGTAVPDVSWGANGYRLPTEAEWEKAARGGIAGKRFPWGTDTISHSNANFWNEGVESYVQGTNGPNPIYNDGTQPFTSPVGSFAANGYLLYDMSGNVFEWCWDRHGENYYTDGAIDPRGPSTGVSRVVRGGSWAFAARTARCCVRPFEGLEPDYQSNFFGFRPARSRVWSDFAEIPAGSVTMGVTPGDPETDAPQTTVLVDTFYLQRTETTKSQWDTVRTWALANGYSDLEAADGKAPEHPVHSVRWIETVKWCNARSEMEGLRPCYYVGGNVLRTGSTEPDVNWSANGYRLPTEAEWEKAARGGVNGKRFPWATDTITHSEANYRSTTEHAYDISPTRDTHPTWTDASSVYSSPVGSFAANAYGLYDMCGNMWEWCWDRYGGTYYATSAGTWNPRGPTTGASRVLRGGSWNRNAAFSRVGYRLSHGATSSTGSDGGFRPARSHLVDDFALISGGSFTMGRTSGDTDVDAPSITVTLSPYYVAETETTKAQWDAVRTWAVNNGYTGMAVGMGTGAHYPVQTVTWWDVLKWCNARSEQEGLTPVYTVSGNVMRSGTTVPNVNWTANGYRLPTEAEWEKAARGGISGKRFPSGADTISHGEANFNNDGGESYQTGTTGYHPTYVGMSPAGSFAANGYGLKDMAGNVWEWCWDWYSSNYYATGTTDPRGPASGSVRVLRGGSWNAPASRARAALRHNTDTSHNTYYVGCRTVRSSVPELPYAITSDVIVDTRSNVANLSALTLSDGTLDPIFATATTSYTAVVPFAQTSITVTPTKAEANATIEARVNNGSFSPVTSGSPTGSLVLNVGANPIDIRVTAQDTSTTITYTVTVTRAKGDQAIDFAAITDKITTASVPLSATGGASGNAVTFAVTTGPATINGSNQLTFTGAGSVTITASQAGNAEYNPAPAVPRTFNVTKATATVNLTGLFQTYDGSPRVVGATTVPSGKTVNLTYAGSSTAPTDPGSYAIVATIDDPIYQGGQNTTLTVNKASQSITFGAITDKLANATVNLSATGGASGNPVTFAVTDGPASINGSNQLTFTGAGSVTVAAYQAGNTNYNAATPVPRTFNVTQANATVTISDVVQVYDGTPCSVTVTTSPPGLAHSVSYLGQPGPPTNAGIYGVNATVTDPRYNGFDGADLVIQKAPQAINFPTPPDTVETAVLNLSATGGASGIPVTYAVTNGPAFLSGPAELRFNGAGSVTVTASQAGNSNYNSATPVPRTFLVDDSTAEIAISDLLQVADGNPHPVTVTTDPPGLTVNLTYNGSANPPVAAGRYTVVATVDDALYDGTQQVDFILDDPGVLIRVPGGSLPQRSSLGPLQVETFQIGRYEVTWGLWKTVRDWAVVNGYQFDPIPAGCADNHPVRRVKWFDAVKWCNARTEWENATLARSLAPVYRLAGEVYRSGIYDPTTILADETAGGYRLPTAVEWEFAARGGDDGTETQFPGGNDLLPLAWYRDNSTGAACNLSNGRGTWPVGEKSPNELGIFDLAGNVIEWTWTPIPGSLNQRFSLGGSWDSDAAECQIGALYDNGVTYTDIRYGFRVGRSVAAALTVALDDEQRAWESSGTQPWFAQTGTTHDGIDAAESGDVYPGEESRLETTLNGPGNLSFRWKAASIEGADEVAFYLGTSSLEGSLTGATDWEEFTLQIPGGERSVSWVFRRHPHSPAGPSRAWVDQVVYTPVTAPILTTAPAGDVTTTGATLGGEVTADGGREVTDRGIVWSTDPNPTVEEDTIVTGGTGTGAFTVPVSGLTGGMTYHVRAFATNNVGTSYGAPVVFTTRTTVAFTDGVATFNRSILPGDGHVFDLTLSGPRFVSFSTTEGATLRAELRDAEGNVIAVFEGDTDFDLDELLYAGGYALHIYRQPGEGATQTYTLVLDASLVAATRPDMAVGTSPTALIGRGVYSPAVQLVTLTSRRARQVTGYASLANRGNLPDVLSVGGTRGTPLFALAYFGPQGNITAALLAGSYRTPELNENSTPVSLRVTIKPNKRSLTRKVRKRSVILRRTHDVIFQAGSTFDPAITDAATIRVQTR